MKKINFDQLTRIQKESPNLPIINVLSEQDFNNDHITGSQNVPFKDNDKFVQQVEKIIGGKTKPVILYCASSTCDASKNAAQKLESSGFTDVTVYEGGVKEWSEKTKSKAA